MLLLGHDDVIIHSGKMMSCFILTSAGHVLILRYDVMVYILPAIIQTEQSYLQHEIYR